MSSRPFVLQRAPVQLSSRDGTARRVLCLEPRSPRRCRRPAVQHRTRLCDPRAHRRVLAAFRRRGRFWVCAAHRQCACVAGAALVLPRRGSRRRVSSTAPSSDADDPGCPDALLDPADDASDSDRGSSPPKRRKLDDTHGLIDDCPLFPGTAVYVTEVAGASIRAATELRDGKFDVAINWHGGRYVLVALSRPGLMSATGITPNAVKWLAFATSATFPSPSA